MTQVLKRDREIEADLPPKAKFDRRRRLLAAIPHDELRWIWRSVVGTFHAGSAYDTRMAMIQSWEHDDSAIGRAVLRHFERAL